MILEALAWYTESVFAFWTALTSHGFFKAMVIWCIVYWIFCRRRRRWGRWGCGPRGGWSCGGGCRCRSRCGCGCDCPRCAHGDCPCGDDYSEHLDQAHHDHPGAAEEGEGAPTG